MTDFLAAAVEIGEALVTGTVSGTVGLNWIGDDLTGDADDLRVVTGPVGPDLYSGAAGIAWFLAHLARATGDPRFAVAAHGGARFALAEAADRRWGVSLYSGRAGIALAAMEAAQALADTALQAEAQKLAHGVADVLLSPDCGHEASDLIGGLAGSTLACIAFHRRTGDRRFLEAATAACRYLSARRAMDWWGASWPEDGETGLCGLAHGASGIGLALAETAWATGDRMLLDIARRAFDYERGLFAPERCGWPDLREPGAVAWTTAWCHGALGIGAVRLRLYSVLGEDWALAEASSAIQAARILAVQVGRDAAGGLVHDVTLCHGLGGVTELMLLAADLLGSAQHRLAGQRVARLCLKIKELNAGRWTTGLRGCHDVPGLFPGLAGIGVMMLRAHDGAAIGTPMLPGVGPGG